MDAATVHREHRDLLETLDKHREFLRTTVHGLDDEQAARRSTVSELCLGGIVKHVAAMEAAWTDFIVRGTEAMSFDMSDPGAQAEWANQHRMLPGETLAGILADYDAVAARTAELVAGLTDLDADHALPEAPWFEPGARWSARRALLHVIAETAQHAGHADIIREAIDGAKTMG